MSDHYRQAGATSNLITVAVRSSTTGQLLTGILYSAVTILGQRTGAAGDITYTLVAGTLGVAVAGSWVETNVAGCYQFCPKDSDLASGVPSVDYKFSASGALDATAHVVLIGQAAGILSTGTGEGQISLSSGQVLVQSGTASGQISASGGVPNVNLITIQSEVAFATGPVTFPNSGILASTTNITAGTITLVATTTAVTNPVGMDWSAISNPNASVNLSGTQTEATGTVTLVSGNVNAAVVSMGSGVITATSLDNTAVVAIQNGLATETTASSAESFAQSAAAEAGTAASAAATAATEATAAASSAASAVTGIATLQTSVDGIASTVGTIVGTTNKFSFTGTGPYTVNANASISGNVTVGAYADGQDPATLVLDTAASGHNSAGSIGAKINAAGGAADPLANAVPGSYAMGTAGYAIARTLNPQNIMIAANQTPNVP